MKKNIIALIISTTLIGGIGTTAYASVGRNVDGKIYIAQYRLNENSKNGYINYIKGILSGKKVTSANTNTCTSTETNTQVNSGSGQTPTTTEPPVTQTKPVEQTKPDTPTTTAPVEQTKPTTPTTTAPVEKTKPTAPTTQTPVTQTNPTTPVAETTTNVSDKFMAKVEQLIYQKVNEERAKVGASTLTYNSTMEKYARIKSQDMGDKNYFDHEDLQGNLITERMKNDGVTYKAWGENIAYIGGVTDENALANQFMTNWMNSPGHKANILSTNFSSIGVGVYRIGNKVYATQEFYK